MAVSRPSLVYNLATVDGNNGAWSAISDRRIKEHLQPLPEMCEKLQELKLYSYNYIKDTDHNLYYRVVAQELMEIFPNMISNHGGFYGVQYDQLTVVALKALQELTQRYDQLTQQVADQQEVIARLADTMER